VEVILQFISAHVASFIWSVVAFVVFILVLYRFGITWVLAAVDARDEKLRRELAESEAAYAKAKGLKQELDEQLRNAERKISEMMGEARRDAEAVKASMVEQARTESEAVRQRALGEIDGAKRAALIALRREVAEISLLVAEKTVREKIDAVKNEALVAEAIASYQAGSGK
jgi:F-type H+-transporting ATPase subunit b